MLMLLNRRGGTAFEPAEGAVQRFLHVFRRGAVIDAFVERHDDVSSQTPLNIHRAFWRQRHRCGVAVFLAGSKLKTHAGFRDFAIRQTEDLESSGIGEDRLIPSHHGMQAAESFDNLRPIQDSQMIRIGQHDLCARCCDLVGQHAFHCRLSSNGHKRWRFNRTMRGDKTASPRASTLREELIMKAIAWRPGWRGGCH